MPIFARAPLVVREALIFPYLDGAEFMHWWETAGPKDTLPYGRRMPVSTEQILHPERYARGDLPVPLEFPPDSGIVYEDVLGENEIRVLLASLAGSDDVQTVVPIGWGGDRFRVYRTPGGPALVWYVAWDDQRSADRFLRSAAPALQRTARPGYRSAIDTLSRWRAGRRRATCWRRRRGIGGISCRRWCGYRSERGEMRAGQMADAAAGGARISMRWDDRHKPIRARRPLPPRPASYGPACPTTRVSV